MEKTEFQKLLGDGLKEFKGAVMEEIKGEIKTAVKPLEDRMAAIEKLPAKGVHAEGSAAIITSSKYKGYNLAKQMVQIREKAAKNPRLFPMFSDDQKCEAFAKFLIAYTRTLKGDMSARQDMQEFYQKANYAEGSDATGGYLVPIEYENEIVQLARDGQQLLNEVSYYEMGTDNKKVPKEGSMVSVEWDDEAGTIGDSEGTFDEIDLVTKRLNGLATVSNELLMDSSFDLAGILTEQFGYATGQELINQILNGTGSPFYGVAGTTAGYSVVMTASTTFAGVTADDFSLAMSKLSAGYLANAKWVINRVPLHYVRTLKDSQGRPLFAMPGGAVPGTIYGLPYLETEKSNATSSANKCVAVLGNWKKYAVGRRVGTMALDADPYGLFTTNKTRFRMITRWALKVGIAEAFCRYMTHA